MAEEEVPEEKRKEKEFVDTLRAEAREEMKLYMKEMRNKFLQEDVEEMKADGVPPDELLSDKWWEYIPDFYETRHWLTGLYLSPPVNCKVVICKDHPSLYQWMREEVVFGVVLSVQPAETVTARYKNGLPIFGKDGKELRIPGIPRVEVAFSDNDYEGGFYLPADCLKARED